MDDNTRAIYEEALKRPEYTELVGYLTSRGVTPQGRLSRTMDQMMSINDLVYELTHVAKNQMQMQAEESPQGELAKLDRAMQSRPSAGAEAATDFRVLLDLATREQQQRNSTKKARGML